MRRLLLLFILFFFCGCSTVKYVPVEAKTDSVYVEKVVERLDTVYFQIPVEVKDIITYADSSHIETSIASSDAWVDSLFILHHKLENKGDVKLKKEVIYKDRIIEKEVVKEIPVIQEVEVPVEFVPDYYKNVNKGFWILLSMLIVIVGWKIFKIVRKIYLKV